MTKKPQSAIEIRSSNVLSLQSEAQYYTLQYTQHLLAFTMHNALQIMLVMHCTDVKNVPEKNIFKMLKVVKNVAGKTVHERRIKNVNLNLYNLMSNT